MKNPRMVYWIASSIIFLSQLSLSGLAGCNVHMADVIKNLGYPTYFMLLLIILKMAGAFAIILPYVHARIKEWAYAGLAFAMFSALVSHAKINGPQLQTILPLLSLFVLGLSYKSYHDMLSKKETRHSSRYLTGFI